MVTITICRHGVSLLANRCSGSPGATEGDRTIVVRPTRGVRGGVSLSAAGGLPSCPGSTGAGDKLPTDRPPGGRLPWNYATRGDGQAPPYGAAMPLQGASIPQTPYQHQPYVMLAPAADAAANPLGYAGPWYREPVRAAIAAASPAPGGPVALLMWGSSP